MSLLRQWARCDDDRDRRSHAHAAGDGHRHGNSCIGGFRQMSDRISLYSAIDEELTHYEVDVENGTLTRRASLKAPSFVQYAWPHPSRKYLYVTTSNRGPGLKADVNHVSA